jgi:hypothetical protein
LKVSFLSFVPLGIVVAKAGSVGPANKLLNASSKTSPGLSAFFTAIALGTTSTLLLTLLTQYTLTLSPLAVWTDLVGSDIEGWAGWGDTDIEGWAGWGDTDVEGWAGWGDTDAVDGGVVVVEDSLEFEFCPGEHPPTATSAAETAAITPKGMRRAVCWSCIL